MNRGARGMDFQPVSVCADPTPVPPIDLFVNRAEGYNSASCGPP